MCNLYSMSRSRAEVRRLFRVTDNRMAAFEPRDAVFPSHVAPVVRSASDGEREFVKPETILSFAERLRLLHKANGDDPVSQVRYLYRLMLKGDEPV